MTSLAINSMGQFGGIHRKNTLVAVGSLGELWIAVMTKETAIDDAARKIIVVRPVVTGCHAPGFFTGIPYDRQLQKLSGRCPMQIVALLFAGPDRKVDFLLEAVDLTSVAIQLISALEESISAPRHHKVLVRCFVVQAVPIGPILNDWKVADRRKRLRHAHGFVRLSDRRMTGGACLGTNVGIRWGLKRQPSRDSQRQRKDPLHRPPLY